MKAGLQDAGGGGGNFLERGEVSRASSHTPHTHLGGGPSLEAKKISGRKVFVGVKKNARTNEHWTKLGLQHTYLGTLEGIGARVKTSG